MNKNPDIKTFVALAFIGYAMVLIVRYLEWLILSISKIIAYSVRIDPKYMDFIQLIPGIIIIILWLLLLFVIRKDFNGTISIKQMFTKKRLLIIGMAIIVLHSIVYGLQGLESKLLLKYGPEYIMDHSLLSVSSIINTILGFVELVIIAVGLFLLSKQGSTATSNGQNTFGSL